MTLGASLITEAVPTSGFALFAWLGTLFADGICKDVVPHDDGPVPLAFPRWPFALAGAILGFAASEHGTAPLHLGLLALVVLALSTCAACDLRCGMLPDVCTLGALGIVLVLSAYERHWQPATAAVLVAIPFAAVAWITRNRGMGWGDVKLAALGGALLGTPAAAMLSFSGASIAAYLVAWRAGRLQNPVAFGPYLAGAIVVGLALGSWI